MKFAELKEVILFETDKGKQPFKEWLSELYVSVRARIEQRILRLSLGNYGDYKPLKNGLYELRLKFGPGYRVYFGGDGKKIVIILNGGDKKTQSKDIKNSERILEEICRK